MGEKPRVLIIDDDAEIVHAVTVRLHAAGYDVIAAADGDTGVELALENQPNVIVLDIQMPTTDGLTVLAQIHAHSTTRSTPVVVLSACSGARKHALKLGARSFVDKPYDAKVLLAAIEDSLVNVVSGVK